MPFSVLCRYGIKYLQHQAAFQMEIFSKILQFCFPIWSVFGFKYQTGFLFYFYAFIVTFICLYHIGTHGFICTYVHKYIYMYLFIYIPLHSICKWQMKHMVFVWYLNICHKNCQQFAILLHPSKAHKNLRYMPACLPGWLVGLPACLPACL